MLKACTVRLYSSHHRLWDRGPFSDYRVLNVEPWTPNSVSSEANQSFTCRFLIFPPFQSVSMSSPLTFLLFKMTSRHYPDLILTVLSLFKPWHGRDLSATRC